MRPAHWMGPARLLWFLIALCLAPLAALAAQVELPPGGDNLCPEEGCPVTYDVEVTPDNGTTAGRTANTSGHSAAFTVTNTGSSTDQFTSACVAVSANVTCTGTSPASFTLHSGHDTTVTASFSVGSVGTGTLKIRATSAGDPSDVGSYTINVVAAPNPPIVVSPGAGARAIVHRRQPLIRAVFPTPATGFDTGATVLKWRGAVVTGVARRSRGLVEWEVDSTAWLATGLPGFSGTDSGKVEVTHCGVNGGCSTASQWVVLPNDSTPVLGFSAMPLEAVNGGFGAPFGAGFSVSGADVETGFSIRSYSSMGAARSAGLVYSTRQSYPRALVQVDLDLPWPTTSASSVKLVLLDGAVRLDSLVLASPNTACLTGSIRRCRATLQGEFTSTGGSTPSITRKWLRVEATVTVGATVKQSVDSVEAVIVDRRGSRYGSGWWPAGITQLVGQGDDRVLVGPSGSATIFRGYGDSVYIGPPGATTALLKTASGWELHPRGSLARIHFDAQGRLIKAVDANGNRDSVAYDASTDKVLSLTDPVGKTITLAYDVSGKLTGWTDPAGRQSTVTIAGNQLTRRWLASPAARPDTVVFTYQAYSGTNTLLLQRRQGVLAGDTTTVLYDATAFRRPLGVRLARVTNESGTLINPLINYTAVERQGYGALRSLDSAYVEMKDPRGHWTRSLLTRWGQARRSWDSLGLLSRAEIEPDGLVLWSEDRNGDSSRVHHAYDASRRLAKTYIYRGATSGSHVLRTDSLVYDNNHRVTQRVDARGQSSLFAYDATGNLTMVRTPNGAAFDTAFTWYRSDGLVDSTRQTGNTAATRFFYDPTWKQLDSVVNQAGQTLMKNTYDNLGRVSQSRKRSDIRQTGASTTTYQWARSETFFALDNLVDSTRSMLSDTSQTAGFTPTWPAASDTTRTWRVSHRFDAAGRDTARVNNRGTATLYKYDRLHRLVARRPWADSLPVKDSTAYDAAGNVKKTITRRGITITHAYDSRNRDTLTSIPGVGDLRRAFGGPQGQLTRVWMANAVDSIGGVNGEIRMGYDLRGRLRADTAYTGTTARVSSYSYDTYERPSMLVDPLGTWTTKYEPVRGVIDTLFTPMGDTIAFDFDVKGRPLAPRILSGGRRVDGKRSWKPNETLDEMRTWVFVDADSFTAGRLYRAQVDVGEYGLVPEWQQQAGLGQPMRTLVDSTVYDAWGRLMGWKGLKSGVPWVQVGAESYSFDRSGNINQPTGAANYHATRDQLLGRVNGAGRDSLRYDDAGNLIQFREASGGPVWDYGYDALGRLVSVRRGGVLIARYGYDVLGQRVAKRVYSSASGGTIGYTRFVYRGGQVTFETDSAGTMGLKYTHGGTDRLLAITDGATHYYITTDKLGSVRALTRRDGTWALNQRFGPYGERIARDTSASFALGHRLRFGWTGRELDAETGLSFHRARYYFPSIRRWTQEDPIGYLGSQNLYTYVMGSPLQLRDPTGLDEDCGYQLYRYDTWDRWTGDHLRSRLGWEWECWSMPSRMDQMGHGTGGGRASGSAQPGAADPTERRDICKEIASAPAFRHTTTTLQTWERIANLDPSAPYIEVGVTTNLGFEMLERVRIGSIPGPSRRAGNTTSTVLGTVSFENMPAHANDVWLIHTHPRHGSLDGISDMTGVHTSEDVPTGTAVAGVIILRGDEFSVTTRASVERVPIPESRRCKLR